jgi:hypothetical protein
VHTYNINLKKKKNTYVHINSRVRCRYRTWHTIALFSTSIVFYHASYVFTAPTPWKNNFYLYFMQFPSSRPKRPRPQDNEGATKAHEEALPSVSPFLCFTGSPFTLDVARPFSGQELFSIVKVVTGHGHAI